MGKELTDAVELIHKKNDRIKKLYKKLNPTATKIPDGDAAITTVFSPNKRGTRKSAPFAIRLTQDPS